MTAPLPPHEQDRLRTLARFRVFGTEPEPAFDRLTSLAARLFQIPMAGLSLLGEDRQWMKSRYGLDFCVVDRESSFAAHAVLLPPETGVFLVPDTTLDPRFADSPLVTGQPHIRFFAGAPLRTPGGQVLGCFGVLDTAPRTFSAADQTVLMDLAAMAMDALELRYANLRQEEEAAERHRAEAAGRRSEGTLRQIAANAPGMVFQFAWSGPGDFQFTFVGAGCRELFGVDPQALYDEATLMYKWFTPGDCALLRARLVQSVQTLGPWNWECPYTAPDGSSRWVECMARPERPGDGGSTLWNGMLLDVTERRQAQQKLEDNHILLSAIINGTTDAVFVRDVDSRYLLINPAGAAFLGAPPEEVIGQTDDPFFDPAGTRKNRERDLQVIRDGRTHTYEDTDVLNGIRRDFLSTKTPFRDAAGNLIGVIGVAREITAPRRAARALQEAKEEAERANRAKSEFLSRMSHELRTPLNAILGFGQLLELYPLPTNETESVVHILKAGQHLLKLIDEVLAISRIEAGHLNLSVEAVGLSEMADECLQLVGPMAQERGVRCEELRWTEDCHARTHVMADRQRLRQVLLNLLSNAIKYNRQGGHVGLSCLKVKPEKSSARLRLEVSDTGLGLSEEEITRLFTPFERLKAEHGPIEGTGLGLALSKGLIEAMGGTIGVRSQPGEGSTFWVELPLAEDPLAEAGFLVPAPRVEPPENCWGTVLYIEDNLSNSRLVEMLLERHANVQLLGAAQGSLGLEIARSRRPDLILLDLHLPDLPGWEVLAALQADPRTHGIPTVIVSADATPNQIERLRQAGARDYLTKPIHVPTLLTTLRKHLQPSRALF